MIATFKLIILLFIVSIQNRVCFTNSADFQSDVNSFIDAFDEAYSTEHNEPVTNVVNVGNEIPVDVPVTDEEPIKNNEDQPTPVAEEPVVREMVFPLGGDIHHELTDEVQTYASTVIKTICNDLSLIKVTEAVTSVSDKVRRRLSVVVGRPGCADESCGVTCTVELLSVSHGDQVTSHNCLDTNEVMRVKRGAIGGFKQVDEEEAYDLAGIAMITLDKLDADETKRVVVDVIRAQKQLVNGIMYHLTLNVASSDCREDQVDCKGPFSDHTICKILMQRLFSGEAPHNAQVIKSECTPISEAKAIDNKKRGKRDISHDGNDINSIHNDITPKKKKNHRLMGGLADQDPNADNIKEIAKFGLSQIDKMSNSLNKQKIVRVVEARSQVVAGVKYFLKLELVETDCRKDSNQVNCSPINSKVLQECDVVIWDKPWMKFRAMTSSNCQTVHQREKRALGGKKQAEVNSYNINKIAEYAVDQLEAKSNSLNAHKLIVVKEAQTQVVAGTNYFLKLQLVETKCRKGTTSKSQCEPAPNSVVQECDVVIYDKPWEHHREMTSSECHAAPTTRTKREMLVGGLSPADPNDNRVKEMAQFAVSALSAKTNSLNKQILVTVTKAQTQVVAGANYYLKLQMVESTCLKGASTNEKCNAAPGAVVQECDVVVYDRPWDKHREMTSAKCSPAPSADIKQQKQRNRRDTKTQKLAGGLRPADPNEDRVQEMAQFAVSALSAKSNSLNKQNLVTVKEAQTQVVAGANYYLKLQMVESTCLKGAATNEQCKAAPGAIVQECDVVVYDRPWDKHREMTSAKCSPAPSADVKQQKHRDRRDIKTQQRGGAQGGRVEMDKSSAKVNELAHQAVRDVNRQSNSLYKQALLEVVSAQSQVLSGVKYFLTVVVAQTECRNNGREDDSIDSSECRAPANAPTMLCDYMLYERPWENAMSSSFNCSGSRTTHSRLTHSSHLNQQRGGAPGGRVEMDKSSAKVTELAHQAVRDVNRQSNSAYRQALLEVVSAQSQVVSGVKYFLTVVVAQTECRNNGREDDSTDSSECRAPANAPTMLCDFMLYERPWENAMTSSFNCSSSRTTHSRLTQTSLLNQQRSGAPGGRVEMDKSSAKVTELAHQAVRDVNRQSNSMYRQALLEVVSAQSQVVSGVKYFLTVVVAQTECRNNGREDDNTDSSECRAPANAPTMLCDYVFYERPWENAMTSSFNCSASRTTHARLTQTSLLNQQRGEGMAGGRVDMDKSSAKVSELAHQAVRDVNRQSNSLYKQALLEVVSAQSQVVSGVKYFLTVVVAQTECRNNGREDESTDSSECHAPANAPTMLCDYVVYERSWENSISSSFNCSSSRSNLHSTHSRLTQSSQLDVEGVRPGAPVEMDKNSNKVRELANKAVRDVNMRLNSPYKQALLQVISAKSQVVNGVKYYLKIALAQTECFKNHQDSYGCQPSANAPTMLCDYVFSQQPSENAYTVSHYNCADATSGWRPDSHHHFVHQNPGQSGPMPGGPVDMDKSSAKVTQLAHQAVRDVNRQLNSAYKQALLEVVSAQSQMVNGVRYYLKVALAQTNCPNNGQEGSDSSVCQADDDAPTMLCNFLFYEELGQNSASTSSFNCSRPLTMSSQYTASETRTYQHQLQNIQESPSGGCFGCVENQDVHSESVQVDARKIVNDVIDQKSNSPYRHKLVEVLSSQSQVVSGYKYWLTIKIVESSCRKGTNQDIDQCSPRDNAPEKVCTVTSIMTPGGGKETSFSCSSNITRSMHSHNQQLRQSYSQGELMPGAPVEMDKSSAKVTKLAHQAVRDVNRQSNSLYKQALLEVVSAKSQVVSGVKYFLTVVVAQTECRNNGREDESSDSSECRAPANAPTMTCNFVLYEGTGHNSIYSSSFNCSGPLTMSSRYSTSEATRTYQHQHQHQGSPEALSEGCDGCVTDDVHSESVQANARDLVRNLIDKKSNSPYKHKLLEVVSARSQVVEGTKYWFKIRIMESSCRKDSNEDVNQCSPKENAPVQECEVTSLERPGGGKQSSFRCSSHISYSTDSHCDESHESIPGGLTPRDPNEDDIQTMARYALTELDASSNSLNQQKILQVTKAQSQVVAGTNYYLKLRLVETNCRKGHQSASECAASPGAVIQECDVVVYNRPWDNHREMTSAHCKDTSQQTEKKNLGRWASIARTDPKVQEAAKLSLKTIDSRNNDYYKTALVDIVESRVQHGSGNKYMLLVKVGESTCSKDQEEENCPLKEDSSLRYKCNVIVWDRPWLNKMEVLNSECNVRDRRSVKTDAANLKADHLRLFEDFKNRYNKTYEDEAEHKKRFRIFRANLKKIESFQAHEQGTAIYGASMFADLTEKEFKQGYLGLNSGPVPRPSPNHMLPAKIPDVELPTDFDWRDHGAVTPVKNQGQCGSCWAFSVTGNVEGQWFMKHGKLYSLSEQELVDCDKSDSGCNGGYMTVAYEAIEKLGGLETEDEYPYDARDETCHFNKSMATVTVASSLNITTNETQIAQWLFKNGPISIGINANAMQFYMGGVSHPFKFLCNKKELDHGVLLVGFGIHRTSIRHKLLPYWLIKNSWGPHWGEKGYYRVYRGDGTCGVNQMASSAVVA